MARTKRDPEAAARLLEYLKPGGTVYTVLRHRAASGMSRTIQVVTIENDRDRGPWVAHLGYNVAAALGLTYDRDREGVRVSGCGMDMGFWLAYEIGATLWPDGYKCPGKTCQSNDHSNGAPVRKGKLHRDGGYALRHSWI
jgi:hypothetical protein